MSSSSIHVGVTLPWDGLAVAARQAEESGLDGLWCGDHLAWHGPYLDSTAVLTAAAAVTERVTVGWSVMLPALRPAGWAAKHVATVQHVSGGRLQLGVGIGPAGPEWAMAGTSATGRAARTDAFLAALPDLLAGRRADPSPEGNGPDVELAPAVPSPPLWIGGTSDAALRRAARFDAGWLASMLTPDRLASRARDLAARTAVQPRIATMVFAAPTERPDPAASTAISAMLHSEYGVDADTAAVLALSGPPEQLAESFARYRDAGADTLIVVPFGHDPQASYTLLGRTRRLLEQA